jgi:hypothetical protein
LGKRNCSKIILRRSLLAQSSATHVERVVPGFAAERSGRILSGDVVLAVDGVGVGGVPLDAIRRLTVGPEGTSVTVEAARGREVFAVTLVRQVPTHPPQLQNSPHPSTCTAGRFSLCLACTPNLLGSAPH